MKYICRDLVLVLVFTGDSPAFRCLIVIQIHKHAWLCVGAAEEDWWGSDFPAVTNKWQQKLIWTNKENLQLFSQQGWTRCSAVLNTHTLWFKVVKRLDSHISVCRVSFTFFLDYACNPKRQPNSAVTLMFLSFFKDFTAEFKVL